MNRSLLLRLAVGALIWLMLAGLAQALAATNTIANSSRVDYVNAIIVRDLLPPECAGLNITAIVIATPGGTTVSNNAANLILGSPLNDTIRSQGGTDCVVAGGGNDLLYGGNGRDYLLGGPGNDTLYGDAQADYLYGEDGDDRIYGGAGNDVIDGGPGYDACYGEGGTDTATNCESWVP